MRAAQPARNATDERLKLQRIIVERGLCGLCGLANDTTWEEFISAMYAREGWRPRYRVKCLDGIPSSWNTWLEHVPFPRMTIEWLDVAFLQETREHRLPPRVYVTDHAQWLEEVLRRVGLDYQKGNKVIRIFGYSPRSLDLFDQ